MPVPISISELSTTPGSNSPSGSDSPSVLDDHLRTAYAFIKTLSDEKAAIANAVLLTGNQTIAGTKTFSSPIAGSVTGSAASVSGTVAIANGGTGQTTAVAARGALEATRGIQPITASVASSALTLTLNPTTLDFRSSTLGSGTVNTRTVSAAISLVISSGSTLGTINAVASRIAVLAIDNAGTVELAAVNVAGGVNLDEAGVVSTTAEGGAGAADSALVIYSTTARSNVPYRVVGYVESTQTTAGTWATAPSLIQGAGGNAVNAMQSFGMGQTAQNVAGSRSSGVTYYNTTSKPIVVNVVAINDTAGGGSQIAVIGEVPFYGSMSIATSNRTTVFAVIPPGKGYVHQTAFAGSVTSIVNWTEQR